MGVYFADTGYETRHQFCALSTVAVAVVVVLVIVVVAVVIVAVVVVVGNGLANLAIGCGPTVSQACEHVPASMRM